MGCKSQVRLLTRISAPGRPATAILWHSEHDAGVLVKLGVLIDDAQKHAWIQILQLGCGDPIICCRLLQFLALILQDGGLNGTLGQKSDDSCGLCLACSIAQASVKYASMANSTCLARIRPSMSSLPDHLLAPCRYVSGCEGCHIQAACTCRNSQTRRGQMRNPLRQHTRSESSAAPAQKAFSEPVDV